MQIDHIELTNFKRFESLSCDFQPGVNLLVGSNMSGKTSILEAINVALGCFFGSQESKFQCLMDEHHARVTFREIDSKPIAFRMSIAKVEASSKLINLPWYRTYNSETKSNDDKGKYPASNYGKKYFIAFTEEEDRTIAPLISYYSTQRLFRDSSLSKKQKYDAANGRKNGYLQCLKEDAIKGVLREWLGNAATRRATLQIKGIDQTDHVLENVESAIRSTLVDFLNLDSDFSLQIYQEPDFENELFLQFDRIRAVPLSYYSDGFRNLIYLVMDLVWRASQLNPWLTLAEITEKVHGVVTIDEIDLHLHPKWQAKAIPLLQKLFPKVQFFITTHSPTVVANFDKGTLYVVGDNQVKKCSEKYFGKDVDAVLRNILGANDRHGKTQERIDLLYRLIDEERSDEEITPVLSELTEQLSLADPDVQRAKSLIQWNNYKKENPDAVHQ